MFLFDALLEPLCRLCMVTCRTLAGIICPPYAVYGIFVALICRLDVPLQRLLVLACFIELVPKLPKN
jgi:hypothetical protein